MYPTIDLKLYSVTGTSFCDSWSWNQTNRRWRYRQIFTQNFSMPRHLSAYRLGSWRFKEALPDRCRYARWNFATDYNKWIGQSSKQCWCNTTSSSAWNWWLVFGGVFELLLIVMNCSENNSKHDSFIFFFIDFFK